MAARRGRTRGGGGEAPSRWRRDGAVGDPSRRRRVRRWPARGSVEGRLVSALNTAAARSAGARPANGRGGAPASFALRRSPAAVTATRGGQPRWRPRGTGPHVLVRRTGSHGATARTATMSSAARSCCRWRGARTLYEQTRRTVLPRDGAHTSFKTFTGPILCSACQPTTFTIIIGSLLSNCSYVLLFNALNLNMHHHHPQPGQR
ncbi:hypothetical protein U9M48_005090 [Paspalum notatum var. saurae]|uniref:Uncharacterized protein n=1 Tax=Paspalum notatum var. saurae TaxID=547442 RepID=A0AAQ3PPE2_PASNO